MSDTSTEAALSPTPKQRKIANQSKTQRTTKSLFDEIPSSTPNIIETIENVLKLFDMCLRELCPSILISSV